MKKALLVIMLCCLIGGILVYRANNDAGAVLNRIARRDVPPNGSLHYRIHLFGLIPLGEAVFEAPHREELGGRPVYRLAARARTSHALDAVFSGSASVESYVDTTRLLPVEFRQRILLKGKPEKVKTVYYDQERHVMTIAGLRREIKPDTHDDLSVIFSIRRMHFDKETALSLNLNTNQKTYAIEGSAVPFTLKAGTTAHPLVRLSAAIFRRDKNPYHRSTISMVLWSEKENMPLIINAFASGILVNATLSEVK